MYPIEVCYRGSEVYLNKKHRYSTNEILVQILNGNVPDLKKWRGDLNCALPKLILESDMDYDKIECYNDRVQETQRLMHQIDGLMREPPFYEQIFSAEQLHGDKLFDCLNSIGWVWQDRDSMEDDAPCEDNDYGLYLYTGTEDGVSNRFYQTTFVPVLDHAIDEADMLMDLEEFNETLSDLFARYTTFLDDLLRVKLVYGDFADHYLGSKGRFLTEGELAQAYLNFMQRYGAASSSAPYLTFRSGASTMSHEVLETEDGGLVLCEAYRFETLGAFFYHDLFRGIAQRYMPKKCQNCGRYFLIQAGKYSDYCEHPVEGEGNKTCREVGSRKRYDSKCKNDPIWLTYNRAYKAHYARYMKKKMTVAEFERWSAWGVEIRTQADNGQIAFEEYQKEIRK